MVEQDTDKVIARNIRIIRELMNYKQQYVADKIGCARSSVSSWENGKKCISIKNMKKLSEVFNLKDYTIITTFNPDLILKPYSK